LRARERERGGDNRVEKRPRRASAVTQTDRVIARVVAKLPESGPGSRDLENGSVVVARGTPRVRSIVKSRTLFEIQRGDQSEIRNGRKREDSCSFRNGINS
jgi:hypothetical protein